MKILYAIIYDETIFIQYNNGIDKARIINTLTENNIDFIERRENDGVIVDSKNSHKALHELTYDYTIHIE